ncbi:type VII toxin-antitoxin system MntA family adenylyltransferase antitoxin [Colwellia sp. 12G3]|uniref:type VII toxin-antitoxin system MntA family adenylyltransferase antitoxin n=1 Tax=Colwellia sp. 12G3 TaxID=2058299 RepID=UPI000C33EFCC|nr:nucleotidyltransferase domain-containing protein [Colwellia sp. 12G3]PKI17468.1 nucleotidyltransferase domain-containing protein [Colwellia sp. 12G3]
MAIDFHSQLINICRQHFPDIKLLYLFGSHASNQAHANSDIDLAVLLTKKISTVTRWNIQQKLALELNIDVDLIDLLSASTVMQNQIINKGICLYDMADYKNTFEMQVMSMYQHLNDERSSLLTAFKGS